MRGDGRAAPGGGGLGARLAALRAEVLEATDGGDRPPAGAEMFDAVVRVLGRGGRGIEEVEAHLRDALAVRMAWGDTVRAVLADAGAVGRRIVEAGPRVARGTAEEIEVAGAVAEAGCAVARVLALDGLTQIARARGAMAREELAARRLREAVEKQRAELAELERVHGRR